MSNSDNNSGPPRFFPLVLAAVLGGFSTFATDSVLRGAERSEQFAAVKEILTRLEKKVDDNSQRSERDLADQRTRITTIAASHQNQINSNRTAIAVINEQLKTRKGYDHDHDHED